MRHDIRIAVEGVVELLSRHLYSDRSAFVREMIQNGHDSIQKRRSRSSSPDETAAGDEGRDWQPAIQVSVSREQRTISFVDTGAGMTVDEIHQHLSTIGRSGTREFQDQLSSGSSDQAVDLIGRFGIGLLSAFLVAERVEIETRALDGSSHRWAFGGGTHYELAEAQRRQIGSSVTLFLKAGEDSALESGWLVETIRRYADFLPVPVMLDGEIVNALEAPWEVQSSASADASMSSQRDQRTAILLKRHFPRSHLLTSWTVDEPLPGGQRLRASLGIGDALWTQNSGVDLYVRRMFICRHQPGLLPDWAQFVQGVVQCDALSPSIARDRVLADGALAEVRPALASAIFSHLDSLAQGDPKTLTGVLRHHGSALMALALQPGHEEFFERVWRLIPLRTSLGRPVTLPEATQQNPDGKRLRYFTSGREVRQLQPLWETLGWLVLDLEEPHAAPFVRRVAERHPAELDPLRLDEVGAGGLLPSVPSADQLKAARLLSAARHFAAAQRRSAQLTRFAPIELPLLLVETRRGRGKRALREIQEDYGTPHFLADALTGTAQNDAEEAIIYLNLNNPLIAALSSLDPPAPAVTERVLSCLLGLLEMESGRASTQSKLALYREVTSLLSSLLPPEHR